MGLGEILIVNKATSFCETGKSLYNFTRQTTLEYEVECLVLWAVVIL